MTPNTIVRTRVAYVDPNDDVFTIPAGTQGIVVPPDLGPAMVAVTFPKYRGLTVIYAIDDLREDDQTY
jgi:hypothetical protein